jgi:drug/metabolite transporter (DMT)-like permease
MTGRRAGRGIVARISRHGVGIGLVLAVVLDTAGQLLWKRAAVRLPESLSPELLLGALLHDPLPLVVLGVFVLQLVNWLLVLERAELSYAQPITSLSYVSVVCLSVWLLGERLDPVRLLGVSLVLLGVALVGVDAVRRAKATT